MTLVRMLKEGPLAHSGVDLKYIKWKMKYHCRDEDYATHVLEVVLFLSGFDPDRDILWRLLPSRVDRVQEGWRHGDQHVADVLDAPRDSLARIERC